MNYKIAEIEGIGPVYAEKLKAVGLETTNDFLKLCCEARGRTDVATRTGISEALILTWANMADLMRVSGIGKQFSELLHAAGVDTIKELRTRNAENLTTAMKQVNDQKKLSRTSPSLSQVSEWIRQANGMTPTITH